MERTTFSLLFYIRRTKLNKEGEAPIFMRVTVNGQRADASVKRFIAPKVVGRYYEPSKYSRPVHRPTTTP